MSQLPRQNIHNARAVFAQSARKPVRRKVKTPPPFSLRLSDEERAELDAAAAGMALGSFIKAGLFDGDLSSAGRGRAAVKDHAALAQVPGMLGNIAWRAIQLAKAANIGTLPLTPQVEEDLQRACAAVIAMRAEPMRALGREENLREAAATDSRET